MKVESIRDAFLSDYEVLQFMSQLERKHYWSVDAAEETDQQDGGRKSKKKKRPYNHPELQAITRDAISYLSMPKHILEEGAQPENEKSPITKLNDGSFTKLMKSLNEFALFKAEKLQIVNQLPTNMVHLYAIVEECDSRFSEDQVTKILEIVQESCM